MVVVMAFVLAQQGRGMALVDDQDAVEEFAARVPTKRSAIALARGARTGVPDDAAIDGSEDGVER